MQNNNNNFSYPNVEFPYNYTKNGQKQLRDKYLNQTDTINTMSNTYQNNNTENVKAQENTSLDINKLLPLLLNKNLQTNDLLDVILPMINKNNLPIKYLLKIRKQNEETSTTLPTKEPISINGYKKVE